AYRFLQRNCLIAGLSRATVVIEAPERSGAIHTANRANEMGRHVFVVPANIENINFRGSHALIRDGAILVDHPDLVMDALGVLPSETTEAASPISEIASKILSNLSTTPLAVEFILDRTGLPMSDVIGELTLLELEGRIIHDAGGYALKP
ncbi:MAG TPA: DNA-processing protein DprA, partial [Nitrospira sp.]|nr:DNA-processing protein DprA [Nitrospira sp.]